MPGINYPWWNHSPFGKGDGIETIIVHPDDADRFDFEAFDLVTVIKWPNQERGYVQFCKSTIGKRPLPDPHQTDDGKIVIKYSTTGEIAEYGDRVEITDDGLVFQFLLPNPRRAICGPMKWNQRSNPR
jgi:hypothetical protein